MTKRKAGLFASAISFVGAFVPALFVLTMLAANNNQGEVYDTITGNWDLGYTLSVSVLFYVPSFAIIRVIAYCAVLARGDR